MYAIVESGGKQYQVEKDAVIRVEKIAAEPGSEVVFDKVLMTGGDSCHVGTPYLKDVLVKGQVVAQGRGPKVLVFKGAAARIPNACTATVRITLQ